MNTGPLKICLQTIDKILSLLFNFFDKVPLLVCNGLTQAQVPSNSRKVLYRQINPEQFLRNIGVSFKKVEQLMTNDAHIFFSSVEQRDQAANILSTAKVGNQQLFEVDPSTDSNKLFFQVIVWDELAHDSILLINNKQYAFFEHFKPVVSRTGAHIPYGDIFYRDFNLPTHMPNYELYQHITEYFS
ncbi:hypothetical protein [Spartinivicinus ruber]|uniref:hypothetical protein n=1 Tax=Spartinivicinus ruber TaxID=2683272 RepID=UPI001CA3F54B|nr:hypothetical protein [Spartinivicinus ruber]